MKPWCAAAGAIQLRSNARKYSVHEHAHLKLSDKKAEELTPHMRAFTKPLVIAVYGDAGRAEFDSLKTMMDLFSAPDADKARTNLLSLAKELGKTFPAFSRTMATFTCRWRSTNSA